MGRGNKHHATQAHPTEEHLLPIFVALGASGENFATRIVYQGFSLGTLAMDSFAFDAAEHKIQLIEKNGA